MTNKTKIKTINDPLEFPAMIDISTYKELLDFLTKKGIRWGWAWADNITNIYTIKMKYKNSFLYYDFEIVK